MFTSARLKSWLHWVDDNLILLLSAFLIAFIPLYPKIPLWSPIEQYIVRVRLEDILVLLTGVIWLIWVWRKKIVWRSAFLWMILAYALVGLLSVLSAFFLIKSVPLQPLHVGKTLLHYFRYLEYFSLFAILFSAIKKRSHVWLLLIVVALTVIAIAVYGYGQKYFYFPVYSTMNREFSKGVRLYLTPHARVQSTFAGHYDMAAYLVVVLPLLLALAYKAGAKWQRFLFYTSFWLGSWLLIVSASRTSFVAFLAGAAAVLGLTTWQRPTWRSRLLFGLRKTLILGVGLGMLFMVFGADLTERLSQVLDSNPQVRQSIHDFNKTRKQYIGDILEGKWPGTGEPPDGALSTDEAIALGVLTPTDERPITTKPSDVYVDVPDIQQVASTSADGVVTYTNVDKGPRTYSDCALKYGLSLCIRLDTLWPRAIQGFTKNPLLGYGYATLNKESVEQFTEAESTDNNFLRTLGETGLLGFLTFYGVVALGLWFAWKSMFHQDILTRGLSVGFIGGTIALLLNAVYIDVFAASKVAFTYWSLLGLLVGYLAWLKIHPQLGTQPDQFIQSPVINSQPISRRVTKRSKSAASTKGKTRS